MFSDLLTYSQSSTAWDDLSAAHRGRGTKQLITLALLIVAVGEGEGPLAAFQHGDIGDAANAQSADIIGAAQGFGRSTCRFFDDSFQGHTEHKEFAHRCWHIVDWPVDIAGVQIGANGRRLKTLLQRLFGHIPIKATLAVANIEEDPAFTSLVYGLVKAAVVIGKARAAGLETVGNAVAWRQVLEHLGD